MKLLNDKAATTLRRRKEILKLKNQISAKQSRLDELLQKDADLEPDAKKAAKILDATRAAEIVQKRLRFMKGKAFKLYGRPSYLFYVKESKFTEVHETSATITQSCSNVVIDGFGPRMFDSEDTLSFYGVGSLPDTLMKSKEIPVSKFLETKDLVEKLTKLTKEIENL